MEKYQEVFPPCESIVENSEHFGITPRQKQLLVKLSESFRSFYSNIPFSVQPKLINSEEWTKVKEVAKEVLRAFNDPDPDIEKPSLFRDTKAYLQQIFRKFSA